MPTSKKPAQKRDYVKHWMVDGTGYNQLRYKTFKLVNLPKGDRYSKEVQQAAKIALLAYQELEADRPAVDKKKRGTTLSDALSRYFDTPAYRALRLSTQVKRRSILNRWGKEYGDLILSELTPAAIETMLAAKEEVPAAMRNLLVAMQHFFNERIKAGLLTKAKSPMLDVRLDRQVVKRINKGAYPKWTQEMVDMFRAHWPMGTMERLAFELMLLTGMAAADVIRFSPAWIGKDSLIRNKRRKTGTDFLIPCLGELRAAIEASPWQPGPFEPFLRDPQGRIWYAPGKTPTADHEDQGWRNADFSQWFTVAARNAGLPHGFSAHGVRKRAACDDCLKGWKVRKLMAKFGWTDEKEVIRYTLEAEMELEMLAEVAKDAAD